MGEIEGQRGVWAYVEGGMGGVSKSLAACAVAHGAEILTEREVVSIDVKDGAAVGVTMRKRSELEEKEGGGMKRKLGGPTGGFGEEHIRAKFVMSNATPKVTFLDLIEEKELPEEFKNAVKGIDYSSATMKINGLAESSFNYYHFCVFFCFFLLFDFLSLPPS